MSSKSTRKKFKGRSLGDLSLSQPIPHATTTNLFAASTGVHVERETTLSDVNGPPLKRARLDLNGRTATTPGEGGNGESTSRSARVPQVCLECSLRARHTSGISHKSTGCFGVYAGDVGRVPHTPSLCPCGRVSSFDWSSLRVRPGYSYMHV